MSAAGADGRWDVPSAEVLKKLAAEPLPLGVRATAPTRSFLRDVYYDTSDAALRTRGVTCRIRHRADGGRELAVSFVHEVDGHPAVTRADAEVTAVNAQEALEGTSEPARLLRSIVNQSALGEQLELEIERYARTASKGWLRPARFALEYDIVTVRAAGLSRSFQEIVLRTTEHGFPSSDKLSRAMSEQFSLRALSIDRRERGEQVRVALQSESLARGVGSGRWVVIAALDGQRIATQLDKGGGTRRLPAAEGSGEDACRHLLRRVLGSSVGELHLLTTTSGEGHLPSMEVWIATRVDRSAQSADSVVLVWTPIDEMLARVGTPEITDSPTLGALAVLSRSELLPRLLSLPSAESVEHHSQERKALVAPASSAAPAGSPGDGPLLDGNASLLAFNARVLALAEDDSVPLLERLRYLGIVASNMDEFFSVQVGSLKYEGKDAVDESNGQHPVDQRMAAVARQVRGLIVRQHACETACLRLLEAQGIRVRVSGDLTTPEREHLHAYFRSTIFPYLTPRAITATPGHSLPIVADRVLSFAVGLREAQSSGQLHLAELAVPVALPRFVSLPGGTDYVPLEDVIRRALPLVYPGRRVEHAHLFRVTRFADLGVDEQRAGNLTQAIDEHAQRRRHQPVVRIEVEQGMPVPLRDLLLRELQLEPGARPGGLGAGDVYEIPGLLDLEGFRQLADLPMPALAFPPFRPRQAVAAGQSLWDAIREQDVLLHHPYDDFSTSVARFFNDAADDPDVPSIKITLYRAGERSPIVDALRRAASAGKNVTVFVELKARFDEQRNVRWTRQLEASGAHVVQGLPGFKNHSKVGLVVRQEGDRLRRYVHVGTGNYNAGTARVYTDLGLFTCRDEICDDVTDLFNTLTGSSVPTNVAYRECLVAPHALLPALLERIDREAQHARAGRGGRIRMKLNGLSDKDVVQALYRAATAGVDIDLLVRSLCTLRPGLPGVSERIRVVSMLGRFLEHARIYYFGNDGAPEYFIGSADARPRNLRRRVELLAPIHSASHRARLDEILDIEFNDPTAWTLGSDGAYTRRGGERRKSKRAIALRRRGRGGKRGDGIVIAAQLRTMLAAGACIAIAHGSIARAQTPRPDSAGTQRPARVTVTVGAKYRVGWLHRAILGGDYRPLWTTPIEVDVLDLDTTAGGLRPTQKGGSAQTNSLRFSGGNGREYVFRPVEKDFSKGLPPELRETLVRDIAQDQTVGYHPAAALIVARLLDATGLHHADPRLVVMPNAPQLGEFRAEFAGVVGTLEERPGTDFDEAEGRLGATTVISSEKLFERMRKNHENVVDARAFLAARLFDVLVGDRDRHRDQWRWARFTEQSHAAWEPIPRDRDMPFARFEGLGPWLVRGAVPQLITFTSKYPDMVWLNWNAREIDRRLLVGLERPVWDSVAHSLQMQISDGVIDSALDQMPAPYRLLNSAELRSALIARREQLPEAASKFYGVLAREVDFSATDDRDVAEVTRGEDGSVHIALFDGTSSGDKRDAPYLQRSFKHGETREVRVFLHGGDDRVIVRGAPGSIIVRIVGGDGDDTVVDSVSHGDHALRFYDSLGADRIVSDARIRIDRSPYAAPTTAHVEDAVRDWGTWSYTRRAVSLAPAIGLLGSIERTQFSYGFRNDQFQTRSILRLDLSVGERRPRLTYSGTFRRRTSNRYADVRLMASGIELIRFHGFGNETSSDSGSAYYRVFQNLFRVEPGWVWRLGGTTLSLGARGQYSATRADARTLVGTSKPYGSGEFGEVGARMGLVVDRRDSETAPRKGFRLSAGATLNPAVWDVNSTFGEAHAVASTYLSAPVPLQPTLALRVGGQHVWGTFPYHDAAFLGGSSTLRGWDEQRFAGRSSLYGSTELRVLLGKISIVVPAELGVLTFADLGKVFADGQQSDEWHVGYGGGLWIAPLTRGNTLSVSIGQSRERRGFYFGAGFAF